MSAPIQTAGPVIGAMGGSEAAGMAVVAATSRWSMGPLPSRRSDRYSMPQALDGPLSMARLQRNPRWASLFPHDAHAAIELRSDRQSVSLGGCRAARDPGAARLADARHNARDEPRSGDVAACLDRHHHSRADRPQVRLAADPPG